MEKSRAVFWVSLRRAKGDMKQAIGNGVWSSEEGPGFDFQSRRHMEITGSLGARGGHLVSGLRGKV